MALCETSAMCMAGAAVPPEQLVALVTAMRDHLLASAPGGALPADAPAPTAKAAGRKGGKRRGRAAAPDPSEQVLPQALT